MIRLTEIAAKKIIHTGDGRDMGRIYDFEIDTVGGKISGLIVSAPDQGRFFRRRDYMSIQWTEIKKIGLDVILIEDAGRSNPDYMIEGHHS